MDELLTESKNFQCKFLSYQKELVNVPFYGYGWMYCQYLLLSLMFLELKTKHVFF